MQRKIHCLLRTSSMCRVITVRDIVLDHLYCLQGVRKDREHRLELGSLAENWTSIICKVPLARMTRRLDGHKCSSGSTAAVRTRAADESACCCEGLSTVNCSSKKMQLI